METEQFKKAEHICLRCDYWEAPPRNTVDPLGYCSLFDKLTLPGHGLQCTGWTPRGYDRDALLETKTRIICDGCGAFVEGKVANLPQSETPSRRRLRSSSA